MAPGLKQSGLGATFYKQIRRTVMPIDRQDVPGIGTWIHKKNSFSTTDATLEVSAEGVTRLAPVHTQIVGVSTIDAQDAPITIDETLRDDNLIEADSSGNFTIERAASGSSGLSVINTFIGHGNDRHFIKGYGILLRKRLTFTTTAETAELDCGGLNRIRVLGVQNVFASHDEQDALFVDEAVDANGFVTVPSTGTITFRRPAAGSSGLTAIVHITTGDRAKIPGLGNIFTTFVNFSTTDETVEVGCKGYPNVLVFSTIPYGTPVGTITEEDVNLSIDETTDANGVIEVDADNEITLRRAAAGTSGLGVAVNMIGF